jgi:hypothetical protein
MPHDHLHGEYSLPPTFIFIVQVLQIKTKEALADAGKVGSRSNNRKK